MKDTSMRNIARFLALTFIVLVATGSGLQAALITINLTAEVSGVNDRDGLLEGRINVGDDITGIYTYDSDTPDSNPLYAVGDYQHYFWPSGITLSAGGFVFQTDPIHVDFLMEIIDNQIGVDGYLIRSYRNLPLSNDVIVEHISWQLDDYSMTALSSVALPTTAPVLEDWESNYLLITFGFKGYASIQATVTSVEIVPEPSSAVILAIGALLLRRRRRLIG